jgi:hypothetical protein
MKHDLQKCPPEEYRKNFTFSKKIALDAKFDASTYKSCRWALYLKIYD